MHPFSLGRAQCRLKAWATDIAAVLHNPNVKDLHLAASFWLNWVSSHYTMFGFRALPSSGII